jgi:hypothetical protein
MHGKVGNEGEEEVHMTFTFTTERTSGNDKCYEWCRATFEAISVNSVKMRGSEFVARGNMLL